MTLKSVGGSTTGLYFSLGCSFIYEATPVSIAALSFFGSFTTKVADNCYNEAHIVAHTTGAVDALAGLTDADLSGWSCSVHEVFAAVSGDRMMLQAPVHCLPYI